MNARNRNLLNLHRDGQQMIHEPKLGDLFHKNKVKQFYNDNGLRIQTIHDKMRKLQSEYFVVENEQIKKDKDGQPIPLEGKDKKEFDEKFEKLMDEEVNIKI